MPAGSKPGERRGGKKPGTKNKATREREALAAQVIIDGAQKRGAPVLAKDVLERLMKLSEQQIYRYQPTPREEVKKGVEPNPEGDLGLFGDWIDRTAFMAKELAKYQSPTFKAVMVSTSPGESNPPQKQIEGQANGATGEDRLQKASQSYLMLVKGGGR